jgi:putative ABC transport system ATP-binding protein
VSSSSRTHRQKPRDVLIECRGLRKTYHIGASEVQALRGIDLDIADGEFVAVIGPSGSGKSTLLQLLGCLDRPSEGRYRLKDRAVESLNDTELSDLRNHSIGFVFQAFNLILQHNVLENVELPLVYAGVDKRARRERCVEILRQVGLAEKAEHRPTELSGGEAQRVAIARALSVEPLLLLADEPTGNLDTKTGDDILELFIDLNRRGATIVMTTHNMAVAERTHRIIGMQDGRIVADSKPAAAGTAPSA